MTRNRTYRSLLLGAATSLLAAAASAQDVRGVQPDPTQEGGAPPSIQSQTDQHPAGGVSFILAPQVDPEATATLNVTSWLDAFEAGVSLRVRIDPALIPSERLIEMVNSIGMVDGAGLSILSGYDIDVASDIVLGFSGGTAEITNIQKTPQGFVITALMKDASGNIVQPPADELGLYTTGGDRLCFTEETIQALRTNALPLSSGITTPNLPMTFAVLIDRSGSMSGVMEDVKRAAHGFIDSLPVGAHCTVGAFADEGGTYDPALGLGSGTCRSSNFPLAGLQAGGGTDLFRPLQDLYTFMQEPVRAGHQKAVIIITDGEVNASLDLQAAVEALKQDTVTFVYFLGGHEERFLKNLADNYLTHEGAVADALPHYFDIVSEAYTAQTVLRQSACPVPEGGQP
jgi:uncharacterized protein YegL